MTTGDWIALALVAFGFIVERAQFFSAETRKTIRTLVAAVNDPANGKKIVKESPVKDSILLNSALDIMEPRGLKGLHNTPGEAPRVSTARKIGRFLVGLLPIVSRIPALRGKLF